MPQIYFINLEVLQQKKQTKVEYYKTVKIYIKILDPCNIYKSCFNCTSAGYNLGQNNNNNNCYWKNNICQTNLTNNYPNYIIDRLRYCLNDDYSNKIMDQYCGSPGNKYPVSFNLTKYSPNFYSISNLYCAWGVIAGNTNFLTQINVTNNVYQFGSNNIDMYLRVIVNYTNGNADIYDVTQANQLNLNAKSVSQYTIEFYSDSVFNYDPFEVDVNSFNPSGSDYTVLISCVIAAVIICVLCTLTMIRQARRLNFEAKFSHLENNPIIQRAQLGMNGEQLEIVSVELANSNNLENQREQVRQARARQTKLKERTHRERVLNLFDTVYIPEVYILGTGYNNSCSICLENFLPEITVIKTNCKHAYHPKCLKDFVSKNLYNLKCPNCNSDLMNESVIEARITRTFNNHEPLPDSSNRSQIERSTINIKDNTETSKINNR